MEREVVEESLEIGDKETKVGTEIGEAGEDSDDGSSGSIEFTEDSCRAETLELRSSRDDFISSISERILSIGSLGS